MDFPATDQICCRSFVAHNASRCLRFEALAVHLQLDKWVEISGDQMINCDGPHIPYPHFFEFTIV